MTVMSTDLILERVKVAEKESPIAVFQDENGDLDAVFAATIGTQERIKNDDPDLVGVFHKYQRISTVRARLNNASLSMAA